MSKTALTSLAILKVNCDRMGKDYIESFVPVVVEAIRMIDEDVISLPDLKSKLSLEFGLELPSHALKQILKKCAQGGYVNRDHGVYYPDKEECAKSSYSDCVKNIEGTYENIIKKLIVYAKNEHSVEWSDDQAVKELHRFLRENSLALLFNIAEEERFSPDVNPGSDFIVASFVSYCQKNDAEAFNGIEMLVQGNLLANALYLPDMGRVSQKFSNTRIYLDTSFLVYSCGFCGKERAAPCKELIDLLLTYEADLYCFRETFNEVVGILKACASQLKRGNLRYSYGPSMEYFIEKEKTSSDVELMIARLPDRLRGLGIEVDDKPPYEKDYQIDEKRLKEDLQKAIGYANPRALLHDVDCISSVSRLRRGRDSAFPETSWALFVTTNSAFARTVRDFFNETHSRNSVPPCMTDYALGNLLWLKNPTKAPDLPRHQLLAHAYASLQPPEGLWKSYLTEVAKLQEEGDISANDYYILRHSLAAKQSLMDCTEGDEAAFTEGTVKEILQVAKNNLRADLKHRLEDQALKTQQTEKQVFALKKRETLRRDKIAENSASFARYARRIAVPILVLVIFVGSLYTFPWEVPAISQFWSKYLIPLFLLSIFLLTVSNLCWGVTLKSLLSKCEKRLCKLVEKMLLSLSGIETDDEDPTET